MSLGLLLAALALSACEADPGPTPESDGETTTVPTGDRSLTFGVYGTDEELAAYESLVDVYNSLYEGAEMTMEGYGSREELMGEMRESGDVPDVFLTAHRDLAWLEEQQKLQPVDQLLIERGLDFGDLYSRDALLAFSAESRLQCMPVGVSPQVILYNTELLDFEAMEARGISAPVEGLGWNFEQFVAAAEFASRPRRHTRGIYVEPSLRGLAPWIYSAGGEVFDDAEEPTSLAFSDDGTQAALETVLEVLRDPRLTLSDRQLRKQSALEWFKQGKLAMLPGYREQVPQLRQVADLDFDVIPIPSIERSATVANLTGMCMSADVRNVPAAADFLVHMTSPVSVRRLVSTGHLVPANLEVALSDDFLQPGREPVHSQVFTNQVRTIVLPPLIDNWSSLEDAVSGSLETLLTAPLLADLEALTTQIDEESRTVLAPEEEPSEETESP
ncbi:extracellular solute-binding protein [Nocardioides euryhalodurans]|uniref:Extracellular solute-binding protein n=1 Tax=Nocardioides euryhalodurans TaxID=2518370 RepID=A0A4P7GJP2_9ACTN|nr:extracellular solute-binding protein [Nocardioides euryhalodurans]QBR92216.1 extracellular solute-binding protein [Nocardioides euryhalodurans]